MCIGCAVTHMMNAASADRGDTEMVIAVLGGRLASLASPAEAAAFLRQVATGLDEIAAGSAVVVMPAGERPN